MVPFMVSVVLQDLSSLRPLSENYTKLLTLGYALVFYVLI